MRAILLWMRHELRQRWVSLVALALLVALASGTVATAFAGASRGATALDRLLERTGGGYDALIPVNPGISYAWSQFDALPYVEARGGLAITPSVRAVDLHLGAGADWLTTAGDDSWFRSIDRPVVLSGRAYDPDTPDELMITPEFADANDVGVGDDVRVQLPTAEQARRAVHTFQDVRDPAGPVVEWHVVGIVRSTWLTPEKSSPDGKAAVSPATLTTYPANLLGGRTVDEMTMGAVFRLSDRSDLAQLTEDARRISGRTDVDVWDMETKYYQPARDSMVFEARTLAAFGLAALVAGSFLVGGLIARTAAASTERLAPGPAVGMAPLQVAAAAALPAFLAGVVGAVLGAAGSWFASGWFPLGSARQYEPAPGWDADWPVLTIALVVAAAFVAAVAFTAAWRRTARKGRDRAPRVSKVASWFAQVSAPVPVVLGTRLALEPRRGRDAVPVRPAQVGAVAAAAGTVAALVFSHGIDDALANPERFGQIQQAEAFVGFAGQDYGDGDRLRRQVAGLGYVDGVLDARQGNATADDDRVSLIVYSGDTGPKAMGPVVTDGRVPAGPDEIMLGSRTAAALGATVGQSVTLTGAAATRSLTVVGTGFLPPGAHNGYTDGGWVTRAAYPLLFGRDFHFHLILVHSDTLDAAALMSRLRADTGTEFDPPNPVDAVDNLRSVRRFPAALAAFLALLGAGVVANALVLAVRRRQGDLAVVRALGMTGGQAGATVAVQALTFVAVGLLYGVPIGLIAGRALWRAVAETLPLQFVAPTSVSAALWVAGVSLGLTALLAVLPARRAARIPLAAVLRAE
jgi:hypothetical protein